MGKLAFIDGDGLVYAAGAVSETVYFSLGDLRFEYKSEANEHADNMGIPRDEIERNVDPQPVSHALNVIRTMVDSILEVTGSSSDELYLSNLDSDNFRHHIYPEYKANRKTVVRPFHFNAIRGWLSHRKNAIITHGLEPDDLMSIRAQEQAVVKGRPWIIITNDKDMAQIPGDHYNWKTKQFKTVTPWEARVSLYTQILVGDSIDNIKGCPGVGPAKAATAIKGCETEECLLEAVFSTYKKAKPYRDDDAAAKAAMILNTKLVRLLTRRPE